MTGVSVATRAGGSWVLMSRHDDGSPQCRGQPGYRLSMVVAAPRIDPQLDTLVAAIADRGFIAACAQLQERYPKSRYVPQSLPTPDEGRRAVEAMRLVQERLLKELERRRHAWRRPTT